MIKKRLFIVTNQTCDLVTWYKRCITWYKKTVTWYRVKDHVV